MGTAPSDTATHATTVIHEAHQIARSLASSGATSASTIPVTTSMLAPGHRVPERDRARAASDDRCGHAASRTAGTS